MSYIADLHIHSRYSRACSKDLNIPNLALWAKYKGINLLGTGDCLHPQWLKELQKDLEGGETGLYSYQDVRFLLTTEVALLYSDGGKFRRIHLLVFFPSFKSVEKLQQELIKRGVNVSYDGRPAMGLSVIEFCKMVFECAPKALIIPAHIWTPWFGLFGSNSGFDFFQECFKEFSNNIYAIETGLSSEPLMNWRVSDLDNKAILSFSDAHSLPRLGREATVFKGNLSYDELADDIKKQNILETIEFYPEEGKYHYSGHRDCNISFSPDEVSKKGETCPVCKKRLTIGVMERVSFLATRTVGDLEIEKENGLIKSKFFPNRPPFRMLVQLEEIISQSLEAGVKSKKVQFEYLKLVSNLDNEISILTKTSLNSIATISGEKIAEGIKRVRAGELAIEPGFDNTYGKVNIF